MPFQNRVLPTGEIVAIQARGTRMGNRGRIHVADQQLGRRRWQAGRPWIVCRLDYKGINRIEKHGHLMAMHSYTELFFLDEVTALAAGHRPCAECSKDSYRQFVTAWSEGVLRSPRGFVGAKAIDEALHSARLDEAGQQRRWEGRPDGLPDGVMLMLCDASPDIWMKWRGSLLRYTPSGYEGRANVGDVSRCIVLTPEPTARVLAAGYVPQIHPSAGILAGAARRTADVSGKQ